MKLRLCLLSLVLTTVFGTNSGAQPPDGAEKQGRAKNAVEKTRDGGIQEDIEIMRLILSGRLSGRDHYTSASNQTGLTWLRYTNSLAASQNASPSNAPGYGYYDVNSFPRARPATASVDGVYLDGKGVVFTTSIAGTPQDPVLSPATAPTKPVSDWERARQNLRGENPEPAAKVDVPQPTLADVIVAILAENGKNLRLKDNEEVFVVVTFRNPASVQTNLFSPHQDFVNATVTALTPDQKPLTTTNIAPNADLTGQGKTARDFLLLGDLHLRQQQYAQAQENFEKALKLDPKGDPKQMAETFRKLAEAKLNVGQLDEAKAMIESAVAWEKRSKEGATSQLKTDLSPSMLPLWPTKLIVTAGKRQLDDVGAGRITPEEFRKSLRIELVSPTKTK